VARRGRCRATSSATAWVETHDGPCGDATIRRARPPISAERTTFASATISGGSEIVHDL
jgi:hypothetical protein